MRCTGTSWPSTALLSTPESGIDVVDHVSNDLMAEEVVVDPPITAASLRTAQESAVESPGGREIVHREGQMERWRRGVFVCIHVRHSYPPCPVNSTSQSDQRTAGVLLALGAYLAGGAPSLRSTTTCVAGTSTVLELIAWRVVAGLPVMLLILGATGRLDRLQIGVRTPPRTARMLVTSALLIGINWFVFIWAVDTDRLAESSLGYYINPLVSVALGMLFLGERMRPAQWVAVAIATLMGVVISALAIGGIPWISLSLAGSFALYGLVRKQVDADAPTGLAMEMLLCSCRSWS